ncbi:MAG: hypothetical protein ABSC19_00195 [Syntrophorhabdales bacterium]|jgi:hypothetical protein
MTTPGQNDRFESLLRHAYRARESAEVAAGWQERLMARIRKIGPLGSETPFLPLFEQFVWRLVPVASVLALVLIAIFITSEITSWADPLQRLIPDMEESMLVQLLGA